MLSGSVGEPPEIAATGGGFTFERSDQACFEGPGHNAVVKEMGPLVPPQKNLDVFPPVPPISYPGVVPMGAVAPPFISLFPDGKGHPLATGSVAESEVPKKDGEFLCGSSMGDLGRLVFHELSEVVPLRSSSTGTKGSKDLYPLPTSESVLENLLPTLTKEGIGWMQAICLSLNSVWGCGFCNDEVVHPVAMACLELLSKDVSRFQSMKVNLGDFSWTDFFRTRSTDYKGDEIKTARNFCWDNIRHALPSEIGRVPLEEVCTLGAKHYVEHFDSFIKPPEQWERSRPPRVMVSDDDWPAVCSGLVNTGICTFLEREEVFSLGEDLLLNGLFGVSKDEWVRETEVFRLIMNLVPLNGIAHSLRGDVDTLPMWSLMTPFYIQPSDRLLVSSEDVRCFFYTMSVPSSWWKYLAFNKVVPQDCLPSDLQGREVYLAAKVLPMGFLNSVSLAQHVHRNLSLWSSGQDPEVVGENPPEGEIRKDRPVTVKNPCWRIYLDNYDLLERVDALGVTNLQGTVAPAVLALRQEYERWEIPRNLKKSVSRQQQAEVQGAMVDGDAGVAYPREAKLVKYLGAALALVQQTRVTQRQMQVVCGGLVYFSMFRRPLLCCLNSVWHFIESFHDGLGEAQVLPSQCRLEILRFLGLLPLARMDFRTPFHEQVTCSDASSSGGGVCASLGLTSWGIQVLDGKLRGELPELRQEHQVLTVGLFDGIGALRVATDLLGLQVIGHVSVETNKHAARVVESHFPETRVLHDVQDVDDTEVREWARVYSQASVVLVGGGPPCQGVSGLNADRKGALKDERSRLFVHVPRILSLVRRAFPWCQVHGLMESVASMDNVDRHTMTSAFGADPWKCDAGTMTWCSCPHLYWLTWDIAEQEGCALLQHQEIREVVLTATQDLELVCKEGWIKYDCERPFPTFTTSRPRPTPGRKPAGLQQCAQEDVDRWSADSHRYPPYQYTKRNLLIGHTGELRLPSIEEKEFMMGFPVGYTVNSVPKGERGSQTHSDLRHSLVGNTWSVPVVAWLASQLFGRLGLCPLYTPQQIMNMLTPQGQVYLQTRLWRTPLRPLRQPQPQDQGNMVQKLSNLISIKGEDVLLTTPSSQLCKYHRLRATIPARLWKWRVVSGWRWTGSKEHINSLELRAVLTTLKWRLAHKGQVGKRFLHLVDSLVVLHALSRGRSSSRKLRSTLSRICALLLCSSSQVMWGYVHTEQNPADRPSRWARRIRTKFRHA